MSLGWRGKVILTILTAALMVTCGASAAAVTPGQINLTTESQATDQMLAAGEPLAFSVRLLNFGSVGRADVGIVYTILGVDGRVRYRESETVAVDTTAAFVKQVTLPSNLAPGVYTLRTSITYKGQQTVAESSFNFEVDAFILGLHKATFMLLFGATVAVLLIFGGVVAWAIRSSGRMRNPQAFDYSGRAEEDQVYYQLISESIAQMRRVNGNAALKAAADIPGLRINHKTGEVLEVSGNPMVIMNVLVLRYETLLGRRMNEVMDVKDVKKEEVS